MTIVIFKQKLMTSVTTIGHFLSIVEHLIKCLENFAFESYFVTARLRSTTGRYCFHRCLSVQTQGGTPPKVVTPPRAKVGIPPAKVGTPRPR